MKLVRWVMAFAISLSSVAVAAQEINFGIIATDSASAQRERWEPFFR
ncbi:MAG: phosphonate ABC transporter substrate-binding protein, partial [Betaproteobacteria bacterium]|nr:phosphonate ABC transporter substrate-binding protein [Betaproteobacteria bacterium]